LSSIFLSGGKGEEIRGRELRKVRRERLEWRRKTT
jgi:hypothetical protein